MKKGGGEGKERLGGGEGEEAGRRVVLFLNTLEGKGKIVIGGARLGFLGCHATGVP